MTVLDRVRTYAEENPSFTTAFAAWELGVSPSAVALAVVSLLKAGEVRQIEPKKGPYAAVYEHVPTDKPELAPVAVAPADRGEHDAAMRRTVCDSLVMGPRSLARISRDLQLPKPRVKSLLDVLIEAGRVEKQGITKGTKYALAGPAVSAPGRIATAQLHVVTVGTAPRELDDREVAYTTEAGPRALAG